MGRTPQQTDRRELFGRLTATTILPSAAGSPGIGVLGAFDQRAARGAGETLRKVFEANHQPESWGGAATTPWYSARQPRAS